MLRLASYEAVFECEAPVSLPKPAGVLWHSVVGKALHDVACVQPGSQCADCQLLHICDYPALFNTPRPLQIERLARFVNVPSPHIFHESPHQPRVSSKLHMRFSLVDHANARMQSVLAALARVAYNGFGKQRITGRFSQLLAILPNSESKAFNLSEQNQPVATIVVPNLADDQSVRVEFITPYRQPGKRGKSPADFDLSAFLIAVIRRIDLLKLIHSDGKLEADFKALKAMSLRTDLATPQLQRSEASRYSASHGKTIDISGLLGSVVLHPPLAQAMWPFLYTGQQLNVGKNASMGLGQYRLTVST